MKNKVKVILNFMFRPVSEYRFTDKCCLERVLKKIRTHGEVRPSDPYPFDFVREYSRRIHKGDCLIRGYLRYPRDVDNTNDDLWYRSENSPSLLILGSYIRYDGPKG